MKKKPLVKVLGGSSKGMNRTQNEEMEDEKQVLKGMRHRTF